ncbi:hypothetical protein [Ruminococcus sp. 5_1_39BFAA]|uniref:hypothetical protein n=1 Tax=Ruminococcus sp. 5_1_39BFAA TaxID=457412 RepID=UPI00356A130C
MSRQKFQEELKTLEELRTKCDSCAEETLKFYCNCLMKMHRACYKIEETEMLSYVRQIVSPAFPLVIRYFVDRVKACIDETVPEDTKGIIRQDVEESVVEFGGDHPFYKWCGSYSASDCTYRRRDPVCSAKIMCILFENPECSGKIISASG